MNVENPSALARRIGELKREKNAVILAHYYTAPEEIGRASCRERV